MNTQSSPPLSAREKLLREITIAANASIGVMIVRCQPTEVYKIVDEIYSHAESIGAPFRLHTTEHGWATYRSAATMDDSDAVFDALKPSTHDVNTADNVRAIMALGNETETTPDNGVFVMLDAYHVFETSAMRNMIRKQAQRSLTIKQRLFFIVPVTAAIPDDISAIAYIVTMDYPTRDELNEVLDAVLDSQEPENRPGSETKRFGGKELRVLSAAERNAILSNGAGMTEHDFETALALSITKYDIERSEAEDGDDDDYPPITSQHIVDMLREYKTSMLRKTNVLELQPTVNEDQIGGLDLFKQWMRQRAATYRPEALTYGVTPSRGALVVGPPGTGKSMLAKAAGSILNLPVIRFDIGRVFGAYIGQSEAAMRGVLAMLDAMSPVVLMLDEIDKGFSGMLGGSNTDGGTTSRVFGTFLTWMQERDQINRPIFLIMTANRIGGLPPELLRKGRVDEVWSVNVPNVTERAQIVKIHARKRGHDAPDDFVQALVDRTENFVGSEVEAIIEDALVMSLSDDEPGLHPHHIEAAVSSIKPMYVTRAKDFDEMRQWAQQNARPASSDVLQSIAGGGPKPQRRVIVKRKVTP